LLVEGFVITTLDAAVRLNRYLFEELWSIVLKKVPGLLKHYWFNSGLSVVLMWGLAYSNAFNALAHLRRQPAARRDGPLTVSAAPVAEKRASSRSRQAS
jgi:hypothetical protein